MSTKKSIATKPTEAQLFTEITTNALDYINYATDLFRAEIAKEEIDLEKINKIKSDIESYLLVAVSCSDGLKNNKSNK